MRGELIPHRERDIGVRCNVMFFFYVCVFSSRTLVTLAALLKKRGDVNAAMDALRRAAVVAPEVTERYLEPLEREAHQRRIVGGVGERGGNTTGSGDGVRHSKSASSKNSGGGRKR